MGMTSQNNEAKNTTEVTGPGTQDWLTSAAIMGLNLYSGYDTGKTNKRIYNIYGNIANIQAEAEIARANKENLYRNEEAALQGWGADRELRALMGSQKVAQAASGTYGPGDERLTQDAISKSFRQRRDMLRALQLESFERNVGAKVAALGFQGQAKQYRIAAKNAIKAGVLSGLASGFNDTTRYMSTASTFWKKSNYKPESGGSKSFDYKAKDVGQWSKNPANKLSLYSFGLTQPKSFWQK